MSVGVGLSMNFSEPVKEFQGVLDRPENETIIQFLKQYQPSAHSDVVDLLVVSADQLEVEFYCPDTDNHAYYLAHTHQGVVCGAAIGLSALMYRLPNQAISGALTKGGEIIKDIGDNWVSFNPFWPEQDKQQAIKDMQHWCRLSCHYAQSFEK